MKHKMIGLAALLAAGGLALPAEASTIQIIGALGNFDVYNNTPDDPNIPNNPGDSNSSGGEYEHGFEIEFEGLDSSSLSALYPTYCYTRYGCGKIEGPAIGSADTVGPGFFVRYYNSADDSKDVALNYYLGNPNTGPLDTVTPFGGVDHFGVHLNVAPGIIKYDWLVSNTLTPDANDLIKRSLLAAALATPVTPPPPPVQIPISTPVVTNNPDPAIPATVVNVITNGDVGNEAVWVIWSENDNAEVDDNNPAPGEQSDLDDLLATDTDFTGADGELDLLSLEFELLAGGESLERDDPDAMGNDTLQQIYEVYGFEADGTVDQSALDDGFQIPQWRCYYIRKDDGELEPVITLANADDASLPVDQGGCRGDIITRMMTATNTLRVGDVITPPGSNVPEPAALSLLGLGLIGLYRVRRKA